MRPTLTQRRWAGVLDSSSRHLRPDVFSKLSRFRAPPGRTQHSASQESSLPRIVQPSIWHSIIPRALRSRPEHATKSLPKSPSNPATYFIWIYLLIGSQAIRIITIQNEFDTHMRKAELKLGKLREVIEKLQRGEDVDVEGVLGTGDEIQEQEWEDALKEIENEERLWQNNKQRRRENKERLAREQEDANPVNDAVEKIAAPGPDPTPAPPTRPGFY